MLELIGSTGEKRVLFNKRENDSRLSRDSWLASLVRRPPVRHLCSDEARHITGIALATVVPEFFAVVSPAEQLLGQLGQQKHNRKL
jgi:hypothetical protein